jgi:hypothetical protein
LAVRRSGSKCRVLWSVIEQFLCVSYRLCWLVGTQRHLGRNATAKVN